MQSVSETEEWKNLVNNIVFLRQKYNIPKKRMAELLGIGIGTLNKIERGELPSKLSLEIVFNIQEYFGVEPKDIVGKVIKF